MIQECLTYDLFDASLQDMTGKGVLARLSRRRGVFKSTSHVGFKSEEMNLDH